jgi:hypothetical protein
MIIFDRAINIKSITQFIKTSISDPKIIKEYGGRSKIIMILFTDGGNTRLYFKNDEDCERVFKDIYCEINNCSDFDYKEAKRKYQDI